MRNQIVIVKDHNKYTRMLKWILGIVVMGLLLHFPEVFGHSILWVVHTFYETCSFLVEEFLRHVFGLDKFTAQLIVFYLSVAIGIGAAILLWRMSPWKRLLRKFYSYQHHLMQVWQSQWSTKKLQVIAVQTAFMLSVFMYLLI